MAPASGIVYLVGAGPGAPDLITLRGQALLRQANVVFYDHLVSEDFLACAAQADIVFVGKRKGRHSLTQEDINRLLIEHAKRGLSVVRLKGGDPFIFGRGGEEAAALAAEGIRFEVVPGVTSALGAAAFAGIPLTMRGVASSVSFISGHDSGPALDRIHLEGSLCFYMALARLKTVVHDLLEAGRASDTPVAIIEHATRGNQRTLTGTLGTVADLCEERNVESPALFIVGDVVSSRETLSWFEQRPLFGKRVAVPRAKSDNPELVNRLHELGADVFEFPVVEIVRDNETSVLDIHQYDWIVFTSRNAVDALFEILNAQGRDARALSQTKLCSVGEKTLRAFAEHFLIADAATNDYEPSDALKAIQESTGSLAGKRVLIPRADIARSALPESLRAQGATVDEIEAYHTAVPDDAEGWAESLIAFEPNYLALTSAASARNLHTMLGAKRMNELNNSTVFAAVGPNAKAAAEGVGIDVKIESASHRIPGLIEALLQWDRASR